MQPPKDAKTISHAQSLFKCLFEILATTQSPSGGYLKNIATKVVGKDNLDAIRIGQTLSKITLGDGLTTLKKLLSQENGERTYLPHILQHFLIIIANPSSPEKTQLPLLIKRAAGKDNAEILAIIKQINQQISSLPKSSSIKPIDRRTHLLMLKAQ